MTPQQLWKFWSVEGRRRFLLDHNVNPSWSHQDWLYLPASIRALVGGEY